MTQYSIQFSTNADAIRKQLERLQSEVAKTVVNRTNKIKLDLDTTSFSRAVSASFKSLDQQIADAARKIRELQIGSAGFQAQARISGAAQGQKERGELIAGAIGSRQAAKAFDTGSLARYERELESLRTKASLISPDTQQWVNLQKQIGSVNTEMQRASKTAESIQLRESLGAFAPGSLNQLRAQLEILRIKANDIAPSTSEWRKLNKEIQITERAIKKISAPPLTMGQRAGAAGGAFLYGGGLGGGIGSAVGGIAGGLAGGVPGAFTGAALGQLADNLGQSLAGITTQASSLVQLQRGLAMASTDAQDFAQAQEAVVGISQRLLMPLEEATRYFTQLRANTREYNMTVADTAKIMEGTALAIAATGGSSEDLSGAMRAVVQIMSKGGVQAEELRGQLGERFPGAVVKFAKANKMSFEELQDALQNGKVGIADFVKFAEQNYQDYEQFSQKLATAPEFAGRRLQIAFEGLTREIGGLFAPMGASLQDALTEAINGISNFIKENRAYLRQMIRDWQTIVGPIAKVLLELLKLISQFAVQVGKVFQGIFSSFRQAVGLANIGEARARLDRARAATKGKTPPPANRNYRGGGGIWRELNIAETIYRDLGGDAAFKAASGPLQPEGLIFGGPGAGMSTDRQGEDEASRQKKTNLEAFERLRDQLADAFNRAEIERIKARYDLEKRLQEDLFDIQEFGANRLQRQNLQFLRALVTAEQERFEANLEARLNVAQEAGKVDQATSAFAMGKGTASGGAIFGATGRVFNAPGWVHGHFQNQNREALVQDTVEVVMGLIARGVGPELGSGARFSSKMSPRQIEALVRRGVASHKQYASGIGAVDIFVPAGTQVPTPVSGVQNLGGAAGVTGTLPRGTQLMHLDPRSRGLAGAPRKVGSNEARDTMAAANTEIAKGVALETERSSVLVKSSAQLKALAQYTQDAYNIPDLVLDTQLQKKRNDLIEAGVDENVIDYQVRLYEIELQRQHLLKALPNFIKEANLSEKDRLNLEEKLAEAFNASKQAEKEKNDETQRGIAIQRNKEINDYIKSLREEIALLRAVTEEERARLEIQQQYEDASEEQRNQIYDLREIKKNLEEARRIIDDFVTGTTNDYKGFLKAVISGEDAKDALRQFQEGLRDRVLTIFLDFAMAPVEQFFQEQLKGIMNSLMPKAAIEDTPQTRNTTALEQNTEAIKVNTAALTGGQAPAQQAQSGMLSVLGLGTVPSNVLFPMGGMGAEVVNAPMAIDPLAFEGASDAIQGLNESIDGMQFSLPSLSDSLKNVSDTVYKASDDTAKGGATLGQSLGKATQAIGIAAGSIMGIAAGVSQIKEGSTSGVLGGIGSILLSVGGAIGGFGKLFGGGGGSNGISAPNIFAQPRPFANGGLVTGPTLGLVGEGKYNEAIVPLPDGRSIPVKMQGSSSRDLLTSSRPSSIAAPVLSMNFQTTTINGVEYVDRAQLEAAMAETRKLATRDGASRGASLALDKLQNSPSTRRRVGIR